MSIIFMGTPDFAVPALEALAKSSLSVSLAVTQPDRPRGRGHKMVPTPVKAACERLGISVAQPESIRGNDDFFSLVSGLEPDLIVVAAYGRILPKELLDIPRMGCVNIHASLLPRYRGAAPIQRAIEAGDSVTGVTLMRMSEGLDEGDILDIREVPVGDSDTGELTSLLACAGAEMLISDLSALLAGEIIAVPQDEALATYAPMISKEEGRISFAGDAQRVLCHVRAMNPFPGAYALLHGEKLKVKKARMGEVITSFMKPGTVISAENSGIAVATGAEGSIIIEELQLPGGRAMSASDFLRGHDLMKGTVLE
jgi:methionyl-tRNA formyltransferase